MKVDISKLKKGSSELTPECRQLIDEITKCRSRAEILQFLETVQVWVYGKCELYHWIEILDRFDQVLEEAARTVNGNEFELQCDTTFSPEDIRLLLLVLNFTTLLIEHSFSRHLYNSIEHLTQLLSSQNMDIVLYVLNLLYMFSKRSNFIPRLSFEKKELLLIKLFNIAERWGDPNYGLALIDCCMKTPKLEFLYQLFIEYMDENGQAACLEIPDMMDICNNAPPSEIVKTICDQMSDPSDAIKMRIAHRVRLISGFKNYKTRLQFVQARLQAVSVLIYSNALHDNIDRVLYTGFGEELCELIDKEDAHLVDIRAAVLRTLTSMLHFDRNPNVPRPCSRFTKIINYTGAERQGGILPLLVRDCIDSLTGNGPSDKYPLILATSLFSLLYHLASYEAGGHALIKSGMMQSLLRVISWPGVDLEHITFVTRAVRVIDLITNIDIAKFHQNNGLNVFIDRLEKEVNSCREILAEEMKHSMGDDKLSTEDNDLEETMSSDAMPIQEDVDHLDERRTSTDTDIVLLESSNTNASDATASGSATAGGAIGEPELEGGTSHLDAAEPQSQMLADPPSESAQYPVNSYYARPFNVRNAEYTSAMANTPTKKVACVTQRAALLKSMLNFLKKSIQDHSHFNGMRNIMETSLPNSLRHIISNAEYYGPSLFLLATDVVTVYVFNEPSLLSSLQDSGITKVMLQSLLQKDVPATREVLGSLPNVFSALCLNERGLMEFMSHNPFDKLLKVLLSPDYLVAMRRRRSSDPLGDTATNLGNAMDDLMKHHPYLRTDATEAIVRLLNELVRLGTDPMFICWRANKDNGGASTSNNGFNGNINIASNASNSQQANPLSEAGSNENENDSSGEDDEDDDEMSTASQQQQQQRQNRSPTVNKDPLQSPTNPQEREAIPLIDYILNVMKFIEAIFTNSSNGEHCREFVLHGGLKPLLQLLSLPNLPVDSPVSTTAQAVANVCKSILNLAHETKVIDTALAELSKIVNKLKPLIKHFSFPGNSILLLELLTCPKLDDGFSIADYTPLLHSMSSVHGYVVMLVHLCRNASNDMRSILLKRWGTQTDSGLTLLQNLVQLYISLVWESTILLSLCSDEPYVQNMNVNWDDIVAIADTADEEQHGDTEGDTARRPERVLPPVDVKLKPEEQLRYIKSLLAASSRLGRALAELFGTLVKLSVGQPQTRQRGRDYLNLSHPKTPTPEARAIARVLSSILVNGFSHEKFLPKPAPKLKLTFLICSVGFTGPMLFDDKRSSFHLMISQFCEENGLKAFFDMFHWAISLDRVEPSPSIGMVGFDYEHCRNVKNILEDLSDDAADYPEGTGEFLDAWLQLLEKMINPRAILESPYAIPPRTAFTGNSAFFEPVVYLIEIHQLAMHTLRRIWKRKPIANYGVSMTETMITILKHIVKSHDNLRDRFSTRFSPPDAAKPTETASKKPTGRFQDDANVNGDHVRVLTDMGFNSVLAMEALRNTRSLEQATDYLLTIADTSLLPSDHFLNVDGTSMNTPFHGFEMDVDLTEPSNSPNIKMHTGSTVCKQPEQPTIRTKLEIIPEETFEKFCEEALDRVYTFMEYLPESVNSGADLVSVLYRRNSSDKKQAFVLNLVKNLAEWTNHTLQQVNSKTPASKLEELLTGMPATKLFIRLKVSTLLLDEIYSDIRKEFCTFIFQENTLTAIIELLNRTESIYQKQVDAGAKPITPRWLQTLIDFIDSIENVCTILQRKENMRAVCSDNWKWYDASTGKWNPYTEANNTLLKNAYNSGERSVVLNIGRQRYTINFNCMTQVSEASGSHRPVLPALKLTEAIAAFYSNSQSSNKIDNVYTRTVRSDTDGKNVIDVDVFNLPSLLNFGEEATAAAAAEAKEAEDDKEMKAALGGATATSSPATATPAQTQTTTTTPTTNTVPAEPTADDLTTSASTGSKRSKAKSAAKASASSSSSGASAKKPPQQPMKRVQNIMLHEENVGLAKYKVTELITCLVSLMQQPFLINFETKLSILKLCARLTRDYANAKTFVDCGGIQLLLNMRQSCGLMSFPTYAIILIRHALEAPLILQESIERILAMRTAQSVSIGHRELIFVLTQVSSAVARQPSTFLAAAKEMLRADYLVTPGFTVEDSRLLVKSNRKTSNNATTTKIEQDTTHQVAIGVIKKILHAIVQPCIHYGGIITAPIDETICDYNLEMQNFPIYVTKSKTATTTTSPTTTTAATSSSSSIPGTTSTAAATGTASTPAGTPSTSTPTAAKKPVEKYEPCCCSWHIPSNGHLHQKPLLPRSTLLKVLADAVRSYQSLVPRIIVEHVYTPADSILIEKEQTFLSFVLDQFLPMVRRFQDSEVSMMTRVLISSLSDCYGNSVIQAKVVEELHNAIVRALTQADSAEKHIRLQVLIGLIPVMIESPMLPNKLHIQRNNMYRVLLRQGILTDLTKIAQYKDLSNSNTLNTIYSILRPMEILLRLTIAPGSLSAKRLVFGTGSGASMVHRRFYPRFTRTGGTTLSGSIGGDNMLRDIIRNVLSDRRHGLDFVFNPDDMLFDSDDAGPATGSDDISANDGETNRSTASPSRPVLSFDRLWDELLENENLRLRLNRNTNASGNLLNSNSTDHRLQHDDESGNNDNGVGGSSDGASTSSETAAAVADNSNILGEVSTSDSDSDSDDDHNDDDEDDDDDDGNEEGAEDRSETDADEDRRQFIEVFDHIYEPESSETASNDADVDADDEASEVDGSNSAANNSSLVSGGDGEPDGEMGSTENHPPSSEEERNEQRSGERAVVAMVNVPATDTQNNANEINVSNANVSVRTMPTSAWVTPRMTFISTDGNVNIRTYDITLGNATSSSANNERNENGGTGGNNVHMHAQTNAQHGANGQRRESMRRLVFLDQQYCAPMPTYTNPTDEGQIELFNQDALHWWLEEAKNLDLESQTDACLCVAHQLIPFLIKSLKANVTHKKTGPPAGGATSSSTADAITNSATSQANLPLSRRSAIPVFTGTGGISLGQVPIALGSTPTPITISTSTNTSQRQVNLTTHVTPALEVPQLQVPPETQTATVSQNVEQPEEESQSGTVDATNPPTVSQMVIYSEGDMASIEEDQSTVSELTTHADNEEDDFDDDDDEEDDDDDDEDDDDEEDDEDEEEDLNGFVNFGMNSENSHPNLEHSQEDHPIGDADEDEDDDDELPPTFYVEDDLNRTLSDDYRDVEQQNLTSSTTPASTGTTAAAVGGEHQTEQQQQLDAQTIANAPGSSTFNSDFDDLPSLPADLSASHANANAPPRFCISPSDLPPLPACLRNQSVEEASAGAGNTTTSSTPMVDAAAAESTRTEAATEAGAEGGVEGEAAAGGPPPPPPPPAVEMSSEVRAALGDLEVPEGVDPSFLAALPSEMREEVIQEHLRMQRIRQRAQQNAIQVAHDSLLEVNPEFLAALPPNIQTEVLMQQRIEQQRQAAQTANPDDPVDTAAFFQNLPDSLRQAILTDMEESQIAILPPDLAAEAQFLRRDWESRHGARLDAAQSNTLSGYLSTRFPTSMQNLNDDSRWHNNSIWYDANGTAQSHHHPHATIVHHHAQQLHGKPIALLLMEDENHLLDPDSLATLLLFLFIEDPKMNYTRLHRVIRNLCYHVPTREWVIHALTSIIQKTNETNVNFSVNKGLRPQWLKLRVDAAFGYKSNIFIINRNKHGASDANSSSGDYTISINPQAAQMIVKNCLELLFVLAKHFPRSFLPYNRELKNRNKNDPKTGGVPSSSDTIDNISVGVNIAVGGRPSPPLDADMSGDEVRELFYRQQQQPQSQSLSQSIRKSPGQLKDDTKLDEAPSTSKAAAVRNQHKATAITNRSKLPKGVQYNTNAKNFWDVLLNIDMGTAARVSNVQAFPISSHPKWEWETKSPDFMSFSDSPFSKLLEMLPYKVICRSPQLTDMLVKLLAALSCELPKEDESTDKPNEESAAAVSTNSTTTSTQNVATSHNATAVSSDVSSATATATAEGGATAASGTTSPMDEDDRRPSPPVATPPAKPKRKMYSKNFSQLQLIVEVLTHQCGTTYGLDYVSKLIVNLSNCSQASNAIFLQYLRAAILGLAQEVRQAIKGLLDEIKKFHADHHLDKPGTSAKMHLSAASTSSGVANSNVHHGIMQDRFTNEHVVIALPTNAKPSCELQFPAMKKLLSSSSAQRYFLRTLKIFMQVREQSEQQQDAATPKQTLSQIICLDDLWETLSECLVALEESKDEYAVLVLQPTVEAFFLIHASYKKSTNKAPTATGQSTNATREAQSTSANADNNSSTAGTAAASQAPVNLGVSSTQANVPAGGEQPVAVTVAAPQPPSPTVTLAPSSVSTSSAPAATGGSAVPPTSMASGTEMQTNAEASTQPETERDIQLKLDRQKFLQFAEKHRTVLNQILRQSPTHLSDGPFAVLVDHTRILDFDVKRKYFQTELERIDEGVRREENTVSVRRVTVFEDSFRVLYRLGPEEWKNRFYIVFEDEEGQDAGGLLREWYVIISREIFNPMYALFCVSPGDRVTYMINPSSHANPNHLSYFKFVGRVIAKAVHDNKLLECYFTRSFYKHILGKQVKYTDMESQDYEFYKGLDYLMKNDISTLGYELTFSTEVQEFGVTQVRDLIPNGRDIAVTEENKFDYVQLVCQLKMSGSIRKQLDAFLEGFYDIIPKHLISIFNEQELELLISGLPDIDIEDLKANTDYHKYTSKSIQIQWFWRALRSFDQADRAKFLQFVTGTSKVPLQGFGSLEGMNGIQKFQIHRDDRSTDRLPCAHTCFNQLDLPMYKSYDKLRSCLLKAIHECSEGFGFA